jgi:hypothetical protein
MLWGRPGASTKGTEPETEASLDELALLLIRRAGYYQVWLYGGDPTRGLGPVRLTMVLRDGLLDRLQPCSTGPVALQLPVGSNTLAG